MKPFVIRRPVLKLAEAIEQKLRENDATKGCWLTEDPFFLLDRAGEELAELADAVRSGDQKEIPREAADVAALAMMVADVLVWRIGSGRPETTSKAAAGQWLSPWPGAVHPDDFASSEPDAATEALYAIAALCGCPQWEYPGQVVRDVERLVKLLTEGVAVADQLLGEPAPKILFRSDDDALRDWHERTSKFLARPAGESSNQDASAEPAAPEPVSNEDAAPDALRLTQIASLPAEFRKRADALHEKAVGGSNNALCKSGHADGLIEAARAIEAALQVSAPKWPDDRRSKESEVRHAATPGKQGGGESSASRTPQQVEPFSVDTGAAPVAPVAEADPPAVSKPQGAGGSDQLSVKQLRDDMVEAFEKLRAQVKSAREQAALERRGRLAAEARLAGVRAFVNGSPIPKLQEERR